MTSRAAKKDRNTASFNKEGKSEKFGLVIRLVP